MSTFVFYGNADDKSHSDDDGYGIHVSGLMRDFLVRSGIQYDDALELSQEFDEIVAHASWLETYRSQVFEARRS